MPRKGRFDWPKVLAQLHNDEWFLLGEHLPKTTYEAIRAGRIRALADAGTEVMIRNSGREDDGRKYGDIYLRLREDA